MAPKAGQNFVTRKYKCAACGKFFSRSDSLKRHQAIHDSHHVVKPRKRSCVWCSKAKIRCSGERPSCSACSKRKQPCNYEQCRSPEPHGSEASPSDTVMLDAKPTEEGFDSSNLIGNIGYQNFDPNTGMLPDMFNNAPGGHPYDLQEVPFSEILDMSSMPMFGSYDSFTSAPLGYEQSPTTNMSSPAFLTPAMTPSVSDTAYSIATNTAGKKEDLPLSKRAAFSNTQIQSLFPEPDKERDPCGHEACLPKQLLKPQQVQTLSFPNRALPRLSNPVVNKNSMLPAACDFNHLQAILDQQPWSNVPLNEPLSQQEFETCIELYFSKFNAYFPVIHRPTFVPKETPVVLLLSMATLGASLGAFEGSSQLADCLGEWTRRLLVFLAEYNPKHLRTEYYLTAQTLQGIFARLSGNARLFELIELSRGALIDSTGSLGLHQLERTQSFPGKSVDEEWRAWLVEERRTRLIWMIYEYDSSAAFLFNARPCARIAKIRTYLPCHDELWEAKTAQEWARLRNDHPLFGPFFPELLDQFAGSDDDSAIRGITNLRHLKLLMTTIARFQWTWKEIPTSTPIYFSKSRTLKQNTRVAEDSARMMSWLSKAVYNSLKSDGTVREKHLAIANLHIAHMSHLQSSGELLDWLHPFLRGDTPERARVMAWRNRWAFRSLSRVRQAAFNCGQLLGLTRRYPHAFVQQPYCTFHAGTILWSIAPFLNGTPTDEPDADPELRSDQPKVVLDDLPRLDALEKIITPQYASAVHQQQQDLTEWLRPATEDDATYKVSLTNIPDVSTMQGRRQVLELTAQLLEDAAAPPIAQRFRCVVGHLLAGRDAQIHDEDIISHKHMMLCGR